MVKAMEAVISNTMGVNQAAASYNVPPTTLKNRISGHVKHGTKPGPKSYLTPEQDEHWEDEMRSYSRCEEAGREEDPLSYC